MDTLIYSSTNLHRLTLSQHDKAFGLSATPVACYSMVLIPHSIAIDWRAFAILKH